MARSIAGADSGTDYQLDDVLLDVYANEIRFAAQPVLLFESIATIRNELVNTPGDTIRFLKMNALDGGSSIAETATVTPTAMSTSMTTIAVGEHVRAVSVSQRLLQTAVIDTLDVATRLLGRHYAKNRDALIRTALLGSTNVIYADLAGVVAADRAAVLSTHVFTVDLIRRAVERLATAKAPKVNNDAYVCFVHPHQARSLRGNTAWVNVMQYAQPGNIFNGEIGRIEDVRFIETTMVPYIKATTQDIWADGEDTGANTAVTAHATADIYQSIIVGDNAVGLAEAIPVELRDNGVQDFGRTHSLAYYGMWGAGLVDTTAVAILETA